MTTEGTESMDVFDPNNMRLPDDFRQHLISPSVNLTHDGFPVEKDAHDFLRAFLTDASLESGERLFHIYSEVVGVPIYRHHLQKIQDVRCDILALPIVERITLGGIIIDVKRSGVTIGPGISQLHDYLNSAFDVRNGIRVIPTTAFLFPVRKQNSATASWMQHQHIGTIEVNNYTKNVIFFCGEERLLEFSPGGILLHARETRSGRKMGSR